LKILNPNYGRFYGGAAYYCIDRNNLIVVGNARVKFYNNKTTRNGGALYFIDNSIKLQYFFMNIKFLNVVGPYIWKIIPILFIKEVLW